MSALVVLGIRGMMWAAERIVASRAAPKQEQQPASASAKPECTIATARPRSEVAVNGSMQESRIEGTERLSQMDGRVKKKIESRAGACRIEANSRASSGEAWHRNGGEDDGIASSSKLSADRVVTATVEPGAEGGIKETTAKEPSVKRLSEPGERQERGAVEVKKSREKGDGLKVSRILSCCVVRACGGKLTLRDLASQLTDRRRERSIGQEQRLSNGGEECRVASSPTLWERRQDEVVIEPEAEVGVDGRRVRVEAIEIQQLSERGGLHGGGRVEVMKGAALDRQPLGRSRGKDDSHKISLKVSLALRCVGCGGKADWQVASQLIDRRRQRPSRPSAKSDAPSMTTTTTHRAPS